MAMLVLLQRIVLGIAPSQLAHLFPLDIPTHSRRIPALNGWVADWEVEQVYTVKGGAQAAWWATALEFEDINSKSITVAGASADLTKAFDEIQIELLYTCCGKAVFQNMC